LAASKPGNEIQAPMGIVILGGLTTATALNLLLVPVLYRAVARPRPPKAPPPEAA
jgi:Cu/Ag efflux pump CusA